MSSGAKKSKAVKNFVNAKYWQCCKCQKWRYVCQAKVDWNPDTWQCSDNPYQPQANCALQDAFQSTGVTVYLKNKVGQEICGTIYKLNVPKEEASEGKYPFFAISCNCEQCVAVYGDRRPDNMWQGIRWYQDHYTKTKAQRWTKFVTYQRYDGSRGYIAEWLKFNADKWGMTRNLKQNPQIAPINQLVISSSPPLLHQDSVPTSSPQQCAAQTGQLLPSGIVIKSVASPPRFESQKIAVRSVNEPPLLQQGMQPSQSSDLTTTETTTTLPQVKKTVVRTTQQSNSQGGTRTNTVNGSIKTEDVPGQEAVEPPPKKQKVQTIQLQASPVFGCASDITDAVQGQQGQGLGREQGQGNQLENPAPSVRIPVDMMNFGNGQNKAPFIQFIQTQLDILNNTKLVQEEAINQTQMQINLMDSEAKSHESQITETKNHLSLLQQNFSEILARRRSLETMFNSLQTHKSLLDESIQLMQTQLQSVQHNVYNYNSANNFNSIPLHTITQDTNIEQNGNCNIDGNGNVVGQNGVHGQILVSGYTTEVQETQQAALNISPEDEQEVDADQNDLQQLRDDKQNHRLLQGLGSVLLMSMLMDRVRGVDFKEETSCCRKVMPALLGIGLLY